MSTTHHVTISIRGTLAQSHKEQELLARSCRDADGKPYTLERFQNALMELLSQGHERLPIGECQGFDPKTGCPGHAAPAPGAQEAGRSA